MPFGWESTGRKNLGNKPRVLVGTAVGTLATYVLMVRHYKYMSDESEPWVWFGIRSDGRCGRDFAHEGWGSGETKCGRGQCCSSHGWCGHGDDYCSVALGCQSGCDPPTPEQEAANNDHHDHHNTPDDDEYMNKMHHYRYDDHHDDYYHRHEKYGRYGRYHDNDDIYGHDEYHHKCKQPFEHTHGTC